MRSILIVSVFALLSTNATSAATVVLSNFSEDRLCNSGFCFGFGPTFTGAQSFTTDGDTVAVNTIRSEINLMTATTNDLVISLFSTSDDGLPDMQIGDPLSVVGVQENGIFDAITFSANDIVLSPNTTFFFVFTTDNGNPQFQQAASRNSNGFTIGNPASLNSVFDISFDLDTTSDRALLLEIEATTLSEVPLPAAVWMFLTGLGGLGAVRHKLLGDLEGQDQVPGRNARV